MLALSSTACAQSVLPPENSGANQYTETFPGASGNRPTGKLGNGGRSLAKVLGKTNAARLGALGPAGQAAAQLAAGGAPEAVSEHAGSTSRQGSVPSSSNPSGESGLHQVLAQISGTSGSGEMGLLLPLLMAIAVVAAIAFTMGKRRTASPGK